MLPFSPCPGLKSPHLQTIWTPLFRKTQSLKRRRERFKTDDDDFIHLDWYGPEQSDRLTVLLHGLTGSSESKYITGLQTRLDQQGIQSVCINFRGCSGEPNLLPRSYHSGDSQELRGVLKHLKQQHPHKQLIAVGYSLGGNVLLKYQGEEGSSSLLSAAVAVSVPFRLDHCARQMNLGASRIYRNRFLNDMHRKMHDKLLFFRQQGWNDRAKELQQFTAYGYLKTFEAFDHYVTAALHGFLSGNDYYRKASCRFYLEGIASPTLIIHSSDDPFMTPDSVPKPEELSDSTQLELTRRGGHLGFIGGRPNHLNYWLEQRIPEFLAEHKPSPC
ncbi:hydrolase [Endozoicomonas gorgoniicola]|uniref:Hydrolase n=1 Tax=Endozoicomonas gorgoniicola TaxID=1234144 RepID=A0ABT3MRH3_9GAMM|nr:hydrolase [Endozoicomonas gorgoniicola]MCW7551975.1 hydrolase [Endozoicomonas gorgoniicola]